MIVVFLAVGVYTSTWTCDNTFIPTINLSEHFDYNYGFYYAIVGLLSSLLIFNVILNATSTKYEAGAAAPGIKSLLCVVCGVTVGLVIAGVVSCIIMSANGSFEPAEEVAADYNPCYKQKPKHAGPGDKYFNNVPCMEDSVTMVLEQAGANVTKGYKGLMDAGSRVPITSHYTQTDLCPVNVHWHLGAEHLSVGQFDEHGHGPHHVATTETHDPYPPNPPPLETPGETPGLYVPGFVGGVPGRRLAGGHSVRQGFQCHHYDANNALFQGTYDWQHCTQMEIGQTYEIHWPHSAAGACGTEDQYQSPFYDGVFCRDGIISIAPLNTYEKIGVQGQIFTVVNSDDPQYYF